MKCFMREKIIRCGDDFIFPEIFHYSENRGSAVKGKRRTKENETAPKQKNLNDKRAKRYFVQTACGNFGLGDMAVHLSYADEYLPPTWEEAEPLAVNFIRRVEYARKKRNLPRGKYMLVTQIGRKRNGTHRIHHHILMSGGLDRDLVESLWWVYKGTKKEDYKDRILYGWANADRLRPNNRGIMQIAGYMMKDTLGKKHWTQSQNLEKPYHKGKNDFKYSARQVEKICKTPPDSEDYKNFWEKQYIGYEYIDSERDYNDLTGWSVHLIMRKNC